MHILFLIISAFSHNTFAQGYGLSQNQPTVLKCNLNKSYPASAQLATALKKNIPVNHCISSQKGKFEIVFAGSSVSLGSDLIAPPTQITLRCTNSDLSGIYAYGGKQIGYQTNTRDQSVWFSRADGKPGRCFLETPTPSISSAIIINAISTL